MTTTPSAKKQGIKKASLFAWMTLQSVPEETIISPHILEFLEQTLEPIPAKTMNTTGKCLFKHQNNDEFCDFCVIWSRYTFHNIQAVQGKDA